VREISGGSFRSKIRSQSPYTFDLYNRLEFANPSSIHLIRAKMTPIQYQNEENQGARVEARIAGYFYSEYDNSTIGFPPGEVEAKIWIGGNWNGGGATPAAHWWVVKFFDHGASSQILDQGTFATPITLGTPYVLSIERTANQLTFTIENSATGAFEEAIYIPITNMNAPNVPWKEIGTYVYNTTNLEATIEALFDDVMVDACRSIVDFDGDGKTDIAVYHSASGLWYIKPSSGAAYYIGYGGPDYKPVPGNYDGDRKTDVAVYHSPSGLWYIKPSSGAADYYVQFGGPDYKPVPGDYDGDGKTDIAVYHSASGLWFIKKSSDGYSFYVFYGASGYDPVLVDFDGDGKTDFAVYLQAQWGDWYIMQSSDYQSHHEGYGGTDYVPVPGDYDGDGKTDIAVYHSALGRWSIQHYSSTGASYSEIYGGAGFAPVPGDYDGDGKTDMAVYHSASGLWFIKPSSGAPNYYIGYGGPEYTPVNLDYLLEWVY
jgi:hypothetical protein